MPELPEVETIRRGLEKYVTGHTIQNVEIFHPKPFQGDPKDVVGAKILTAKRIGKGLILELSNGKSLAIHIKMTGQLIFRDKETDDEPLSPKIGTIPNKHTHVVFYLDKNAVLYYNDFRRFGWIKVLPTSEIVSLPFFNSMGPEPFKDLTVEVFDHLLRKSSTKIKPFIMDQTKIGGVGNIYANDALFKAKIDPRRSAKSLNKAEIKKLYNAIIDVMELSLKEGGASEFSYVNILGQTGNYQRHTLVYGKKGESCPRKDGGIIERIVLGGRGTFYCTTCQK